ncbi:MAG TPA: alpha/beta fold hydrolase [Solirubrobacteraceae bacterium]|nr:alpha/beta fold hydrolase [Solirubrobacteraceae bacterium]
MRSGRHEGLAYALAEPEGEPAGGVVILHGAGSCKENHADFALACAVAGLAAVTFDQRGHGASDGALGASVLDDIAAIAGLLPAGRPVFLRGSSMGGCFALAAAKPAGAAGVVAICPATPAQLLAAAQREERYEARADSAGLAPLLTAMDLEAAARALGPRLMLLHAEGDDVVAIEHSERLHAQAAGSRFVRVTGGDHRSIQHDPALQTEAVGFLLERCRHG